MAGQEAASAAASVCASSPPCSSDSLLEVAVKILLQPQPEVKAAWTVKAYDMWTNGVIGHIRPADGRVVRPPDRPGRADDKVELRAPGDIPKRGKGGSLQSRQALLHSLVHIENWAIDLSWDIIARFGAAYDLPREFFDDFVRVAEDECRHYLLLNKRLEEVGSHYGAFPAHDGLWESASATAHSLPARLAVESCVHEARGLDVLPTTISKFRNNGDQPTAALLEEVIYEEEISHCAAGVRWLTYLFDQAHAQAADTASNAAGADGSEPSSSNGAGAELAECDWRRDARQYDTVQQWFHALVRRHFHGPLKPPFNEDARQRAGFDASWYMPLATIKQQQARPAAEALPGQPVAAAEQGAQGADSEAA